MKLYQALQKTSPDMCVKIGTTQGNSFIFCGLCKEWNGNALDDFFATSALLKIRHAKEALNIFNVSNKKYVTVGSYQYYRNTIYRDIEKYKKYLNDYAFLDFRDVIEHYSSMTNGNIIIIDGLEIGQYWDCNESKNNKLNIFLLGNGIEKIKNKNSGLT